MRGAFLYPDCVSWFFMSLVLFVFFYFYPFLLAITSYLFLRKCNYATFPPSSKGYNGSKVLTHADLKGVILMPKIPFTIGIALPGSSKG